MTQYDKRLICFCYSDKQLLSPQNSSSSSSSSSSAFSLFKVHKLESCCRNAALGIVDCTKWQNYRDTFFINGVKIIYKKRESLLCLYFIVLSDFLSVHFPCETNACNFSMLFWVSSKGNSRERENQIRPFDGQKHKNSAQLRFFWSLAPPVIAAVVALSPICYTPVSVGQTVDIQRGTTLFGRACIGCHDMGGNIIQPGATLFTKDLERNGVNTEEEIFRLTYYGKGRMPDFGENCTPRGQCTFGPRLQEEDIKILAEFVKLQADQGWPNLGNYGD